MRSECGHLQHNCCADTGLMAGLIVLQPTQWLVTLCGGNSVIEMTCTNDTIRISHLIIYDQDGDF